MTKTQPSALSTRDVSVHFGATKAVDVVSMDVPDGMIYGVIGANGAGKSTLLNAVSRLVPIEQGEIRLYGEQIDDAKSYDLVGRGIGRTFQAANLVNELTALQNVMLGYHHAFDVSLLGAALRLPGYRRSERRVMDLAESCLEDLGIGAIAGQQVAELPYGIRKRVDIARALVSRPRVLLMDEPMAGLSVEEKHEAVEAVRDIAAQRDLTIVLVEHDLRVVTALCEEVLVMDVGRRLATGEPDEVLTRPEVVEAYVGTQAVGIDDDPVERGVPS